MGLEAKARSQRAQLPSEAFIRGQGNIIETELRESGINGRVHPRSIRRRFRNAERGKRLTYGHVEDMFSPTVIEVGSSVRPDQPLSSFLVGPTREHSGLLVNDQQKAVYTDSVWEIKEDAVTGERIIRHITPDRPLRLDGISMFDIDDNVDPSLETSYTETVRDFARISDNKDEAKKVLEAAGVKVPRGILITDLANRDGHVGTEFHDFVATLKPGQEIVVKPNDGVRGDHVVMGDPSSAEFLEKVDTMLHELIEERQKKDDKDIAIVVEERIIPPPNAKLAERMEAYFAEHEPETHQTFAPDQVDHNLRLFLVLGEDPEIIDDEVRFAAKNHLPVNVSKGAFAARTTLLGEPELLERAYATARQAVAALYRHAHTLHPEDPDTSPEAVGVDIIFDSAADNEPTVNEIQFGPGGFNTLASLDGRFLTSIADILVPHRVKALQALQRREQPTSDPTELRRLPLYADGAIIRYRSLYRAGDFEGAQAALYVVATEHKAWKPEENLAEFTAIAAKTHDYSYAIRYVDTLFAEDPDNPSYRFSKALFEAEASGDPEGFGKVQDILYSDAKEGKIKNGIGLLQHFEYLASRSGDYTKALECASDLVDQERTNVEYVYYEWLFAIQAMRDPEEATEFAEILQKMAQGRTLDDEQNKMFLNNFVLVGEITGNYSYASRFVDELLTQEPDNEEYQEKKTTLAERQTQINATSGQELLATAQ